MAKIRCKFPITLVAVLMALLVVGHDVQAESVKFQNCLDNVFGYQKYVYNISSDSCDKNRCYLANRNNTEIDFVYEILFEAKTNVTKSSRTATITDQDDYYSHYVTTPVNYQMGVNYTEKHSLIIDQTTFKRFGSNKLVDIIISYHLNDPPNPESGNIACVRFKAYIYNTTECTANHMIALLNDIDQQLAKAQDLLLTTVSLFSRYLDIKVQWLKNLKQKIHPQLDRPFPFGCKSYIELWQLFQSFSGSSLARIDRLSIDVRSRGNLTPVLTYIGEMIEKTQKMIKNQNDHENYPEAEFLDKSLGQLRIFYQLLVNAEPGDNEKIQYYVEAMFLLIEGIQNGSL